jgi:hypothetical protein
LNRKRNLNRGFFFVSRWKNHGTVISLPSLATIIFEYPNTSLFRSSLNRKILELNVIAWQIPDFEITGTFLLGIFMPSFN